MIQPKTSLIPAEEIHAKHGIPLSTINYYTNLGILPVAGRKGNVRLYELTEIEERIQQITKLKNEGYPLRLIQRYFFSSAAEREGGGKPFMRR